MLMLRAGAQSWAPAASMTTARWSPATALLPSGRVLVAGGGVGSALYLKATEIYDPAPNQWAGGVPALPQAHRATAVRLLNGRVLVAGDDPSPTSFTAYLYDEVNSPAAWIAAGQPTFQHIAGTMTLLPSGEVLLAGGYCGGACATVNTAEVYRPHPLNDWVTVNSMATTRHGHTATLLPSGLVLVAGGAQRTPTIIRGTCELFDEGTGAWSTAVAAMNQFRVAHTATLLPNGKVLVVGGLTGPNAFDNFTTTTEIYDPSANTWTPAAAMNAPRSHHTATLLACGKVLITGGQNDGGDLVACELYDYVNDSWSVTAPMSAARNRHSATMLPSGQVFIAGGWGLNAEGMTSAEIYTPDCCGGPVPSHYSINTGADAAGNLLPVGSPEQTFFNAGSPVGTNAMVVIDPANIPFAWSQPNGRSQWVCPSPSGDGPPGWYTNRWQFNLPCAVATITGQISTDDEGDLYLNGVYIGPVGGFGFGLSSFSHSANFVAGLNTLELAVNQGGGSTGFRAELEVRSECCGCPAQPLVLFNTGMDTNGVALPLGGNDPHYALTNTPGGPDAAVAITGNGLANTATSQWIGPAAGAAVGTYSYQVRFYLPCTQNVQITGRWAVDNEGGIYLNGNSSPVASLTGYLQSNFTQWHPFTINSGLVAGFNTLTFNVTNADNVTALRVELAGTANCCCPPTNTVVLNTGYDHPSGSVYAVGAADAFWTVTADPDSGTTETRPATVIQRHPAWAVPTANSQWLSSYPTAADDLNGAYDFQTRFCLQPGWTNVVLNLCLRADDQAEVFLNGNLILTGPSPGFTVAGRACVTINNPGSFVTGANVLKVRVHNIYSVAMGFNLAGTVTGSGLSLDQPGCCQPASSLSGRKFNDRNANGVRDPGEPSLPDWPIHLSNGQSTTTDANGNYYFANLLPGIYVVTEEQQPGWEQTAPATGSHTVALGASRSVNGLNFGNHYSETNCVQIQCSSNIVAECAGPAGTLVPFGVSASSSCGGVSVVCNPPSPGPFFPGVTTVHCVVTDTSDNTASCDFRVFVVDNTPPVINCPSNIVVQTPNCTSQTVCYSVTATDNCSGNVAVICTPPPCSFFPPGIVILVNCVATDATGHTNRCAFTVTVNSPAPPRLVYNTGVDSNGVALANFAADPHYSLVGSPNAFVINTPLIGGWLPNSAASRWIGPATNGLSTTNTFVYQINFNVPCTNNATITGRWAADNNGAVRLNGNPTPLSVLTGQGSANFSTWHPFTINSGLIAGPNTLTFNVTNVSSVTGLRVELAGTANCCCSVIALESSGTVNGPYTAEPAAVVDEMARTITVPRSGSIRFYQVKATCWSRIIKTTLSGDNLVLSYEF